MLLVTINLLDPLPEHPLGPQRLVPGRSIQALEELEPSLLPPQFLYFCAVHVKLPIGGGGGSNVLAYAVRGRVELLYLWV